MLKSVRIDDIEKFGIVVPFVTPLDSKFEIDKKGFENLVDYIDKGRVQGIFVNSTTGEFYALSKEQKKEAIDIACELKPRDMTVFAGTTGKTIEETIDLTKHAEKRGADIAVIMPFYFYPHNRGLPNVIKEITAQTRIPILLYNNPQVTKKNIKTEIFKKILNKNDKVIGIKDSSGDEKRFRNYVYVVKKYKKNSIVLQGDESKIVYSIIFAGGAVPSIGNIAPYYCAQIWYSYLDEGLSKKMEYYQSGLNWLKRSDENFYAENKVSILKKVLSLKGVCEEYSFKKATEFETKKIKEKSLEIKSRLDELVSNF